MDLYLVKKTLETNEKEYQEHSEQFSLPFSWSICFEAGRHLRARIHDLLLLLRRWCALL